MFQRFPATYFLFVISQNVGATVGTLLGGIVSDWVGRRLTLMFGLTLYGICTAFSAFSTITVIVYCSSLLSGVSWGIFLVLYFLVVWGDLATGKPRFSFYLSGFPFFLVTGLGYLVTPLMLGFSLESVVLTSIFLILLSNIPLILARELLPESTRREMELKRFLEWVKKNSR
jgi:MFS family permease